MREYTRTTRECTFNDFPPEIIAAIRKYVGKNELGDIETNILMGAETSSEKTRHGIVSRVFGDRRFVVKSCVVVTPERVLWATLDNKNQISVRAARLSEVEIKDYSGHLIEDTGLEIFGFIDGSAERTTEFIGLGEEAAAEKLRDVSMAAVNAAKAK